MSSVKLLSLCLKNIRVVKGTSFSLHSLPSLQSALDDGFHAILLFPGPNATVLPLLRGPSGREAGAHADDSGRQDFVQSYRHAKTAIVLIDGTWNQARHMLRHSPELILVCEHTMFATEVKSDFDALRREPASHCMCTLEACACALRVFENSPPASSAAAHLERCLREFVRMQLAHSRRAPARGLNAKRRMLLRALAPSPRHAK